MLVEPYCLIRSGQQYSRQQYPLNIELYPQAVLQEFPGIFAGTNQVLNALLMYVYGHRVLDTRAMARAIVTARRVGVMIYAFNNYELDTRLHELRHAGEVVRSNPWPSKS